VNLPQISCVYHQLKFLDARGRWGSGRVEEWKSGRK
jgi:hypothetical protein